MSTSAQLAKDLIDAAEARGLAQNDWLAKYLAEWVASVEGRLSAAGDVIKAAKLTREFLADHCVDFQPLNDALDAIDADK